MRPDGRASFAYASQDASPSLLASDTQPPETVLRVWLWRPLEFSVAPGPGAGSGRGGRGDSILGLLQFALELLAHTGLQGCGREPLLREATL